MVTLTFKINPCRLIIILCSRNGDLNSSLTYFSSFVLICKKFKLKQQNPSYCGLLIELHVNTFHMNYFFGRKKSNKNVDMEFCNVICAVP